MNTNPKTHDAQLVVRLPVKLLERIDERTEELRADMPGVKLSRGDVVRLLLTNALDAHDASKRGRK